MPNSLGSTDTQTALLEPLDAPMAVLAAHRGLYFGWAGFWMVVRELYEGGVSALGSDGTKYFVPYGEPICTGDDRTRQVLGKPRCKAAEPAAPAALIAETPIADTEPAAPFFEPEPAGDTPVALSANLLPARLLAWAKAGGQLPDLFEEAARRLHLEGPDSEAIGNIAPADLIMVLDQAIGSFDTTMHGT